MKNKLISPLSVDPGVLCGEKYEKPDDSLIKFMKTMFSETPSFSDYQKKIADEIAKTLAIPSSVLIDPLRPPTLPFDIQPAFIQDPACIVHCSVHRENSLIKEVLEHSINQVFGMPAKVVVSDEFPETNYKEQYRLPRSRKKRIRKKWIKNEKNYRTIYSGACFKLERTPFVSTEVDKELKKNPHPQDGTNAVRRTDKENKS